MTNLDRLQKLVDHLNKGELGHEEFDFARWNYVGDLSNLKANGCGTSGCAIGECPIVFPEDWVFSRHFSYMPVLKTLDKNKIYFSEAEESGMQFFELSEAEFRVLFYYTVEDPDESFELDSVCGAWQQHYNSTRYEVAANIQRFIDYKKKHDELSL